MPETTPSHHPARFRPSRTPFELFTPPPQAASPLSLPSAPPEIRAARSALLRQVRDTLRTRHYSRRTEQAYVGWISRFFAWLRATAPLDARVEHVRSFLTRLATHDNVTASTQNQAFSALLFLFRQVLERDLDDLEDIPRAKRPTHLPQVLSRAEVAAVLGGLRGTPRLMAALLYGCGLRVLECRLRVKDVDFARGEITVHDGKGSKDRVTMIPVRLEAPLRRHISRVRDLHRRDLSQGLGSVALPHALAQKYPNAPTEWAWQWVFPAVRLHLADFDSGSERRPPPPPRVGPTARLQASASGFRNRQTRQLPHPATLLRDASPGRRLRRPHDSRALGSQRRQHHHDLHPCPQPRRPRRPQPPGHGRRLPAPRIPAPMRNPRSTIGATHLSTLHLVPSPHLRPKWNPNVSARLLRPSQY